MITSLKLLERNLDVFQLEQCSRPRHRSFGTGTDRAALRSTGFCIDIRAAYPSCGKTILFCCNKSVGYYLIAMHNFAEKKGVEFGKIVFFFVFSSFSLLLTWSCPLPEK